ncbi:hypothetical protein DR64_1284 [Paraburkholderia xenovorans LB400]|uniref:Uncharacterized protein n=1 Tax=Paraburkholderia xenovorans (strain LB400) TaxID=266265 RepID=Q143T7_PARXL|nr:hypothetical protein Bxe_A3587 [Paraburkholderia xenovorans LB400]AIP30467.1 hypothetical protein DR64_1284 [Paraburkholderia xenovorans LB400]
MQKRLLVTIGLVLVTPALCVFSPAIAQTRNGDSEATTSASTPGSLRQQERAARKQARREARASQKAQISAAKAQGQPVGPVGDDYPKANSVGADGTKRK